MGVLITRAPLFAGCIRAPDFGILPSRLQGSGLSYPLQLLSRAWGGLEIQNHVGTHRKTGASLCVPYGPAISKRHALHSILHNNHTIILEPCCRSCLAYYIGPLMSILNMPPLTITLTVAHVLVWALSVEDKTPTLPTRQATSMRATSTAMTPMWTMTSAMAKVHRNFP